MNVRNLLLAMAAMTMAACGGGGSGGSASTPTPSGNSAPASAAPPASAPVSPPSTSAADLSLAERLYKGDQRTPAGFHVEARPASVIGTLSTRHLRNSDLASGPQAAGPTYELCTDDMAQAIDWSERQATWGGQYSDLATVNSDDQKFELVRVPRADVTAMVRHRVFKCAYLDRAGSDLRAEEGSAGSMNQRPLTAAELGHLAEYLWQFTMFNNSDHAVESSSTDANAGTLVQRIRMGKLVRGASGCDSVQVIDWVHTMNATDGSLTRVLNDVRSFQVKSTPSGIESCAG
jgi:hypothetical protein